MSNAFTTLKFPYSSTRVANYSFVVGSINGSNEPISKPANAAFDNPPTTGTTGQPLTFSIESKNDSGDVIDTFNDRFVLKITRRPGKCKKKKRNLSTSDNFFEE